MRYLFASIPALGHALPMIMVGKELVSRGNVVHFLSTDEIGRNVQDNNLGYIPLENTRIKSQEDFFQSIDRYLFGFDAERLVMKQIIGLLEETYDETKEKILKYDPDVLFVDSATYAPAAVARKYDIKWATSCAFPSMIPTRTSPPFTGKMVLPARDEEEQKKIIETCQDTERFLADNFDEHINGFLRKLGIPSKSPAISYANLSEKLLISYSAYEFEYERSDWPTQLKLVGPGNWDLGGNIDFEIPEKYVYVTLGTFWSKRSSKIFDIVLEGLIDYDGRIVIASGFDIDPNLFYSYDSKVIARKYIPNSHILPQCDIVIHHGGFGTTMGTLLAGKPSLVIPIDIAQHENAARIFYRSLGDYVLANGISADKVREKFEGLNSNDSIRRSAYYMSLKLAKYKAIETAADLLEGF